MQQLLINANLPPLSVLVAEDGLANRALARGLLVRDGHHVTVANDGQQAIFRMQEKSYDLVLMDVDMPFLDGLAATRVIRQQEAKLGRYTPVVALTSDPNRDACLAAGMDAFLSKPLNLPAFRHVVVSVLKQLQAV